MTLSDEQLERYARHIILKEIGGAGQVRLLGARVLVIGAGGLGAPLLSYLAAAGVGTLGIVDDDEVSLSNLQRQILYGTEDIGKIKTDVAENQLKRINPDVKVVAHNMRITADNADGLIKGYDLVADGCDNFTTRLAVNASCVRLKKPLVSAAIGQFEGQLSTFKPHQKDEQGNFYPCYHCFVPETVSDENASCSDQGVLGALAGVMGSWQAVEVVKELLGLGDTLAGRVLMYDALSHDVRSIKLKRDPKCPTCGDPS